MKFEFKLMLASLAVGAAVFTAKAEYSASIRWDVQGANIGGEAIVFSYAAFKVAGVADAYLFVNPNGEGAIPGTADYVLASGYLEGGPSGSTDADHTSLFAAGEVNYAGSFSYYVELFNDDGLFAQSVKTWTYDELYTIEGCVHGGGTDMGSAANILHVSDFKAVPEPTSGLLVLMGVALLGLKRRRI